MKSNITELRTFDPKFPDGSDYQIHANTSLTWSVHTNEIRNLEEEIFIRGWYTTADYFDNAEVLPPNVSQICTKGRRIVQYYADYNFYFVNENNTVTKWERNK